MKHSPAQPPSNAPAVTVIGGAFRSAPVARLAAIWSVFKAWRNRRLAVRELRAMPDWLLRDIGIERAWIREAVRNSGARPANLRVAGVSPESNMLLPPQTAAGETKKAA